MTLQELWQLFPVILTAPDKQWSQWAADEIVCLHTLLGPSCTAIHHIGSTAIEGIWAKPIIDLLAETDSNLHFADIKCRLLNAGYLCMHETENRISFNKGYTPAGFADKVFHLHLRLTGDHDEIYFRDYLNAHNEIAKEYEALKRSLCKTYAHDRDGYTNAKSEFVRHYTAIAKSRITEAP